MKKKLLAIILSAMVMVTFIPCITFAADKDIGDAEILGVEDEICAYGQADEYKQYEDDIQVIYEGETLVQDTDYTISYSNNTYINDQAKITFKGMGEYSGSQTFNFAIVKADQSIEAEFSSTTVATGGSIELTLPEGNGAVKSYNIGNLTVVGDNTYVSASNLGRELVDDGYVDPYYVSKYKITGLQAGTGKVTITASGDEYYAKATKKYSITVTGGGSITSKCVTLSKTSYTYDGTAKKPGVTVKVGGNKLKRGTDYTVSYSNNKNASSNAKATVKGKGKYTGTVAKTFTINKAAQKISVNVSATTLKPNGAKATIKQTAAKATTNVGVFTYKSSNTDIVKVKRDEYHNCTVTSGNAGTAKVTITAAATNNLKKATKTITFTVKSSTSKKKLTKDMVLFTYTKTGNKYKSINKKNHVWKGYYPDITLFKNGTERDKIYNNKKLTDPTKYGDYATKLKWNTDWKYQFNTSKGIVQIWGIGNYTGTLTYYYTYNNKPYSTGLASMLGLD